MEEHIRTSSILQLKVLCITVIFLFGTFANANHVETVGQTRNSNLVSYNLNFAKTTQNPRLSAGAVKGISSTKNKSGRPEKSLNQLQLEIQELLRMQKQLNAEILSGKDNAKKRKLIQHISTQIDLRRMKYKRKQQQQQQIPLTNQPQLLQQNEQQLALRQRSKPNQLKEPTLQKVSYTAQTQQNHLITQNQDLQNHQNNQGLQESTQRIGNVYNPNINGIANNNMIQVLETVPKQQLAYKSVNAVNGKLELPPQQQLNAQMSQPELIQQPQFQPNKPSGINQAQLNLIKQQDLMNQSVIQAGSQQHIFIPLSAISMNNMVPRNVLSGEKFIVLDNGQFNTPTQTKSPQKPTTTPPKTTTQHQQITRTTTPLPTRRLPTASTTPPTTFQPTPPTPVNEPAYFATDSLRQEYDRGEIQKQKLEITKLKLEIRELRRKEFGGGMPRGEVENDDAPPRRQMMRLPMNRMPFRFF